MIKKCIFQYPPLKPGESLVAFFVESHEELTIEEKSRLSWILNPSMQNNHDEYKGEESFSLTDGVVAKFVGPNLHFETPESEKLRSICRSFGLEKVTQIEKFVGYTKENSESSSFDKMTQRVYTQLPGSLVVQMEPFPTKVIDLIKHGRKALWHANKKTGMGMDDFDLDYYYDLFVNKLKRNPTEVELAQIAQGNSSHSRHWEFLGKFVIGGTEMSKTLIQMAKETLETNRDGSVKAFNDNGGVLQGSYVKVFYPNKKGIYEFKFMRINHTATAETHNHPTLISPYPGAATGVGGRLRDIAAIGRGSRIGFGGLYFQIGKLYFYEEKPLGGYSENMATPIEILIGSIKGASGYGNPFGEPTLMFENDALGLILPNGARVESIKPIIYTCAVGSIPAEVKDKAEALPGMIIVRIGGKTRRIGVGGGAASSMTAGSNNIELDYASVQRGEPMTGRSAYNVIEHCIFMGDENPIEAIHDQGAGGASNVLTELTNPCGGRIDLRKMQIADPSLSQLEAWISENQELFGFLIKPENLETFKGICKKFECPIEILGETNDSGRVVVEDSSDGSTPVDLPLPEILGKLPQKTYVELAVSSGAKTFRPFVLPNDPLDELLKKVAKVPGVGFLNYMVDHFDGSVGGRTIQGPRVGEKQLPICKYAIQSDDFSGTTGVVSTITRSNPVAMLVDEKATSRMMVAQMLMTLAFCHIPGGIKKIKGRLNVMWPFKSGGGKEKLYSAYTVVTDSLKQVGIGLDGGKDSLSMSVNLGIRTVNSFSTFVLQPYAHMSDFRTRVTPDLIGGGSSLFLIQIQGTNIRMGGSALLEAYGETGNEVPDVDLKKATELFNLIQFLVRKKKIISGSPILKGGILPTIAKMACASSCSVSVNLFPGFNPAEFYFNEEIGVIVECKDGDEKFLRTFTEGSKLIIHRIGHTTGSGNRLTFWDENTTYNKSKIEVCNAFSELGVKIKENLGIPKRLLDTEFVSHQNYMLTFNPDNHKLDRKAKGKIFKVAVLAAPGTNGHHELAYMFGRIKGRFEVQNIQMAELVDGLYDLKDFSVLAFAGGFSYGDVGGSGKGWAASILFNENLKKMFDDFFSRSDTISFGVCNGFQVATLLGILDESLGQKPRLVNNDSGVFEHRPVNLFIPENTKSIMFKGMQGSILPAWSAHGEGKLFLQNADYEAVDKLGLVSVFYTDSLGEKTQQYPLNPNGSPHAIAGLCTKDGRHTFMMPHIERVSASNYHLPYKPKDWNFKTPVWQKAFENIYLWLHENASA